VPQRWECSIAHGIQSSVTTSATSSVAPRMRPRGLMRTSPAARLGLRRRRVRHGRLTNNDPGRGVEYTVLHQFLMRSTTHHDQRGGGYPIRMRLDGRTHVVPRYSTSAWPSFGAKPAAARRRPGRCDRGLAGTISAGGVGAGRVRARRWGLPRHRRYGVRPRRRTRTFDTATEPTATAIRSMLRSSAGPKCTATTCMYQTVIRSGHPAPAIGSRSTTPGRILPRATPRWRSNVFPTLPTYFADAAARAAAGRSFRTAGAGPDREPGPCRGQLRSGHRSSEPGHRPHKPRSSRCSDSERHQSTESSQLDLHEALWCRSCCCGKVDRVRASARAREGPPAGVSAGPRRSTIVDTSRAVGCARRPSLGYTDGRTAPGGRGFGPVACTMRQAGNSWSGPQVVDIVVIDLRRAKLTGPATKRLYDTTFLQRCRRSVRRRRQAGCPNCGPQKSAARLPWRPFSRNRRNCRLFRQRRARVERSFRDGPDRRGDPFR